MGYFKPWRRRFGVLTLVMACVATGVWLKSNMPSSSRGYFIGYFISVPQEPILFTFLTCPHGFGLQREEETIGAKKILRFKLYANAYVIEPEELDLHRTDIQDQQIWYWCGFSIRDGHYGGGRVVVKIWIIPYWCIAVPLTLVSLWLLLSEPHKSTSKKTEEPVPEKVG